MTEAGYTEFACDLCGGTNAVEVPHAREYTGGQPIHICTACGFVYVKQRRSAQAIADSWSHEIYGAGYTAAIPAVIARLTYVAEFINDKLGLRGKRVVDIGAGEGYFLDMIRQEKYGATVFGVEPSPVNARNLTAMGIDNFQGTIEAYSASGDDRRADIVTIMWTLESSHSLRDMLGAAYHVLKDGGHVVVATGSRLLVPFKKPLHDYLSTNPADTHSFRFSANTLRGALAVCGFTVAHVNRYLDSDILLMIGQKAPAGTEIAWEGDDYLQVYNFFERWHVDTRMYYSSSADA